MTTHQLAFKCYTSDERTKICAPVKEDGKTLNPGDEVNWKAYTKAIFEHTQSWLRKTLTYIDYRLEPKSLESYAGDEKLREMSQLPAAVKLVRPRLPAKMLSFDLAEYRERSHWKAMAKVESKNYVDNVRPANVLPFHAFNGWKVEIPQGGSWSGKLDSSQVAAMRARAEWEFRSITAWIKAQDHARFHKSPTYDSGREYRLEWLGKVSSSIEYCFEILEATCEVGQDDSLDEEDDISVASESKLKNSVTTEWSDSDSRKGKQDSESPTQETELVTLDVTSTFTTAIDENWVVLS